MKSFIVLAVLIAVATAIPAPQTPEAGAQTLRQENSNIGVDSYETA